MAARFPQGPGVKAVPFGEMLRSRSTRGILGSQQKSRWGRKISLESEKGLSSISEK